eukprot:g71562.t1
MEFRGGHVATLACLSPRPKRIKVLEQVYCAVIKRFLHHSIMDVAGLDIPYSVYMAGKVLIVMGVLGVTANFIGLEINIKEKGRD